MVPTENGEEIQGDVEIGITGEKMRLMDYIPIYIPTVEKGLMSQSHHEKRFLDFLRAHPPRDWFLKSGFVSKFSPFSLRGDGSRRFRVPFVRRINWRSLINSFKNWIKNPANVAVFIWIIFVIVGLLLLFLVMTGILNQAIPSSSRRKKWTEIINQILNALFTIMCLYQHPKFFHHLALLLRWRPSDREEVRKVYSKDTDPRPHERAHMMVVVLLLHLTCFAQYICCGLFWGYTRSRRPNWALNLCYGIGIVAPIIAGAYTAYSPLGRRSDQSETEVESQHQHQSELKVYNNRRVVVVTSPEWIGGLFDCWDDQTVCCLSSVCTFCVFGWNMERLGFGNMYVHIFTFILLCLAPFLIFNITALNIDDSTIQLIVAITGTLLSVSGLLYGGFWRIQMRKRFKLPPSYYCCGYPFMTDCVKWLFCWSCSLAQEVRTGNFYDVEDDGFYRKVADDDEGRPVLVQLTREARSYSCPSQLGHDLISSELSIALERSSTIAGSNAMRPPLPVVIHNIYT
ncbi:uncharacterized protein [Typha angustifolia]|uniref:uncharacterized protein isoform X1 n=1 Tax=Typha angustifolia TaxID=59011 RepID=UPI003C2C92A4